MKLANYNRNEATDFRVISMLDTMHTMLTGEPCKIGMGAIAINVTAESAPNVLRRIVADTFNIFAEDVPRKGGSLTSPGAGPTFQIEGGDLDLITSVFQKINVGPGKLDWEIGDVDNAFTLKKLEAEEEISIHRLSGKKQVAEIFLYGDGLKVPFSVVYQKQYYKLEQIIKQAKSAIVRVMNETHIKMLKDAGTNVTAFSGAQSGWSVLDRWMDSINQGRTSMLKRLQKKVPSPYATPLYLLLNPAQEGNWTYASSPMYTFNKRVALNKNINVIFNHFYPDENKGLLIFPKEKIQNAILIDEEFDIWTRKEDKSTVMSAFTLFGSAVGDIDQVQTITLA